MRSFACAVLLGPLLLAPSAFAADAQPVELPEAELAKLPDDDARSAAKQLVSAVESNGSKELEALAPLTGIRLKGKRQDNLKLFDKVEKKGVRATLGLGKDGAWAVDPKLTKTRFGVFRGSGYGKTTVAFLVKTETGWMLDEIKTVDYGAP